MQEAQTQHTQNPEGPPPDATSLWKDVVGGTYKNRYYGLGGFVGPDPYTDVSSYRQTTPTTTSSSNNDETADLRLQVQRLTEELQQGAEERQRDKRQLEKMTKEQKGLKSKMAKLFKLFRSSNSRRDALDDANDDDGGGDDDDGDDDDGADDDEDADDYS